MHRIVKYDLLRIIACFAIVLLHVSNSYWYVVDVEGSDFLIMTIYNSFTRFGVPVFFMLSGMFQLDPERDLPVKKWVIRLCRLAAGFYIWSLFYAFQSVIFNGLRHGFGSVDREMWSDAVSRLVMGHGHMWFLLDLFGFYLLVPVFRKVCEDIRVTGYFLLLWVLVRFLLVTVFPDLAGGLVLAVVTSQHLYILTGYIGYFLGGFFLNKVNIPKRGRVLLYISGLGALVFTMVKTIIDCRVSQSYDDHWFSPSNVNILIFSAAVFVLFKHMEAPRRLADSKLLRNMAKSTFFVYMIHPFFIEKLNLLGIKVIAYPVILSIPVMTVGIFVVSMLLGWVAGKIPAAGKLITLQ
ncbi:MAG: acyltransferase family protein [Eubacterium sp.]|nr:acyltransferase family protein [Eubacterium sp.]MCM1303407.1 acyltransferase family protein [Butyrivibrio sp.]MCM1342540.1 acyltransferase family protein [Muribaculaceae bacterium]MCM1410350.1 acyltransferase family protein [Lachnospiraceae bacterium]